MNGAEYILAVEDSLDDQLLDCNEEDNSFDRIYVKWVDMMNRADNLYKGVTVCNRWKKYEYFKEDIVKIENHHMITWHMNKDLLSPKDKLIYSPNTVCFLPPEINLELCKRGYIKNWKKLPYTKYDKNKGWYSSVRLKEQDVINYFDEDIFAFLEAREIKYKYLMKLVDKYENILPSHVIKELRSYKIGFDH